jgi:hypothetical protein
MRRIPKAMIRAALLFASVAAASAAVDAALRKELLAMAREDQLGTLEADAHPPGSVAQPGGIGDAWPRVARLKEIVAKHGWPGRSLVGEDGAHAAWLIAQHADFDPSFQRDCLERMRAAFEQGEATAMELAFLTDRVYEKEGKPQMYGTQGAFGNPTPEEEARVDANRTAIGLEPWRIFIEKRRAHHDAWLPDPK